MEGAASRPPWSRLSSLGSGGARPPVPLDFCDFRAGSHVPAVGRIDPSNLPIVSVPDTTVPRRRFLILIKADRCRFCSS